MTSPANNATPEQQLVSATRVAYLQERLPAQAREIGRSRASAPDHPARSPHPTDSLVANMLNEELLINGHFEHDHREQVETSELGEAARASRATGAPFNVPAHVTELGFTLTTIVLLVAMVLLTYLEVVTLAESYATVADLPADPGWWALYPVPMIIAVLITGSAEWSGRRRENRHLARLRNVRYDTPSPWTPLALVALGATIGGVFRAWSGMILAAGTGNELVGMAPWLLIQLALVGGALVVAHLTAEHRMRRAQLLVESYIEATIENGAAARGLLDRWDDIVESIERQVKDLRRACYVAARIAYAEHTDRPDLRAAREARNSADFRAWGVAGDLAQIGDLADAPAVYPIPEPQPEAADAPREEPPDDLLRDIINPVP